VGLGGTWWDLSGTWWDLIFWVGLGDFGGTWWDLMSLVGPGGTWVGLYVFGGTLVGLGGTWWDMKRPMIHLSASSSEIELPDDIPVPSVWHFCFFFFSSVRVSLSSTCFFLSGRVWLHLRCASKETRKFKDETIVSVD